MSQDVIITDKKRSGIFINIIVCCAAGYVVHSIKYRIVSDHV